MSIITSNLIPGELTIDDVVSCHDIINECEWNVGPSLKDNFNLQYHFNKNGTKCK